MHPEIVRDEPGDCPICGMTLVKKEREVRKIGEVATTEADFYYTCPMHPEIVRDEPGDCPICGMTLVKKTKGDGKRDEASLVTVSPELIQTLGVTTEIVHPRKLVKEIRTVGRIDYNEKAMKIVSAKVPGRIDKLFVDFTGATVRKGDPLVLLYSPKLITTQKEYLLSLETLKKMKDSAIPEIIQSAKSSVEASKQRLLLWGISEKQIEELEKRGEPSIHLTIYAPIGGTVIHKQAMEGMYVMEGGPLYKIADLSTVWLYLDVYEYEMDWVRIGQQHTITTPSYPGKTYTGTISFIDPFLDNKTRTVRVRCEIENEDLSLKPGMFANGVINVLVGEEVIAVPESAVIHSGKNTHVIIDQGEGKFMPRPVTLGTLAEDYYQVLDGVMAGETVVTSANFFIDSESQLKAAISKIIENKNAGSE
ncbi:TPA: efflux RND transporter periplasmic adaptor subunit [Candidatus Poribacteria bacterium]|nr:efflux RND transporter periplasmic adaptor subunit [Candidatus Poribacteria bacterium]